MKAVTYENYGGPDVLRYADIPVPTPEPHQIRVRVEACSINAADYRLMRADPFLARFGAGLRRPTKWPILGSDFAGTVDAVGADVTEHVVGDRVFGDSFADGRGSFAEFVCVSTQSAVPIPDRLTTIEAAAVPLAAITALQGIRDRGELTSDQSVLIHGAGGGVGTLAVQIAKEYGGIVTAVCGPGSAPVVADLGADRIVDYTTDDIATDGTCYDLVLGINGYRKLSTYRRLVDDGGRYVLIGGTARQLLEAIAFSKIAFAFSNKSAHVLSIDDDRRQSDLRELAELISNGQLRPIIERTFPLARVADAMRHVESGHVPGKVVLTVESS